MGQITRHDADALEAMIDRTSLLAVVTTLMEICYGKAQHLEENWQDRRAAKSWEQDGNALDRVKLNN